MTAGRDGNKAWHNAKVHVCVEKISADCKYIWAREGHRQATLRIVGRHSTRTCICEKPARRSRSPSEVARSTSQTRGVKAAVSVEVLYKYCSAAQSNKRIERFITSSDYDCSV